MALWVGVFEETPAFPAFVASDSFVVVFLRMVKKAKPDEIPIEVFSPIGAGANGADQGAQPISVELINEMIRQKPENVGAALRDWMSTTNGNN